MESVGILMSGSIRGHAQDMPILGTSFLPENLPSLPNTIQPDFDACLIEEFPGLTEGKFTPILCPILLSTPIAHYVKSPSTLVTVLFPLPLFFIWIVCKFPISVPIQKSIL